MTSNRTNRPMTADTTEATGFQLEGLRFTLSPQGGSFAVVAVSGDGRHEWVVDEMHDADTAKEVREAAEPVLAAWATKMDTARPDWLRMTWEAAKGHRQFLALAAAAA